MSPTLDEAVKCRDEPVQRAYCLIRQVMHALVSGINYLFVDRESSTAEDVNFRAVLKAISTV